MTLIVADRVLELSSSTGSGPLTLAGAVTGFRSAGSVCANADTLYYYIEETDANGIPTGAWETGIGTWGSGGILTRTTVHASSNGGSTVNFGAGTKRVGMGLTSSLVRWAQTQCISIACSDETTALTAGTGKVTFRMQFDFTLTAVRSSLTVAQASGVILTADVNGNGVSILSTKLTIDNTEKTSTTAAITAVISTAVLAEGSEVTIDIDQVGDGTAKGLKVYLIGYRT